VLLPNTTGSLSRKLAKDVYAQLSYAAPVTVPCSIVHLTTKAIKTPVRADSSATRGNAEEEVSVSKILFPTTVTIGYDDKFEIGGVALRVIGVEQRRDVLGNLDHFEVDFGFWQR
jgi:hypothetical protein